jgi:hypothetical protein
VSRRSSGRHRKSRLPSRRTLSVVTGVAGLVVAVTTGAVPVPLVSPGDAHERDARAEPVTLYADSAAPSGAPHDQTGGRAGSDPGKGAVPGTSETPTAQPSPSAQASTPTTGPGRSRGPSSSPAPSDGGPVPTVPVPLPSTTSSTPNLPGLPGLPLPAPSLPLLP